MNPEPYIKEKNLTTEAAAASTAIIGTLSARAALYGASEEFAGRIADVADKAAEAVANGEITIKELQNALFAGSGSRAQRRAHMSRVKGGTPKGRR